MAPIYRVAPRPSIPRKQCTGEISNSPDFTPQFPGGDWFARNSGVSAVELSPSKHFSKHPDVSLGGLARRVDHDMLAIPGNRAPFPRRTLNLSFVGNPQFPLELLTSPNAISGPELFADCQLLANRQIFPGQSLARNADGVGRNVAAAQR